jgi:hypothetical protein
LGKLGRICKLSKKAKMPITNILGEGWRKRLLERSTDVMVTVLVKHAKFLMAFLKFVAGELQTGKVGRNTQVFQALHGKNTSKCMASQLGVATFVIAVSRCFPCSASTGIESIIVHSNNALATTSNTFMMPPTAN